MHKNLGVESDSGMDATGRGQEREEKDSPPPHPISCVAQISEAQAHLKVVASVCCMFALLAVTTAVTSTEPALTAIVTSKAGTPSIVANPVRKASRSEAPKLSMVAPARVNEASMGCTVAGVTTVVMTGASSARRADSSAARACVATAACR